MIVFNIIPSIGMAIRRLLQFVSSISVSSFGENLAFIFSEVRDTLIIDQMCDHREGHLIPHYIRVIFRLRPERG